MQSGSNIQIETDLSYLKLLFLKCYLFIDFFFKLTGFAGFHGKGATLRRCHSPIFRQRALGKITRTVRYLIEPIIKFGIHWLKFNNIFVEFYKCGIYKTRIFWLFAALPSAHFFIKTADKIHRHSSITIQPDPKISNNSIKINHVKKIIVINDGEVEEGEMKMGPASELNQSRIK